MRILQESICQNCKRSVETIGHALLDCKTVNKIWSKAPFLIQNFNIQFGDIPNITQEMGKHLKKADMELMVAYYWAKWYSRNKFMFLRKGY